MKTISFLILSCLALSATAVLGLPFFSNERPGTFKILMQQARDYMERQEWQQALVALDEAKRRYPRNGEVRLGLAYLHRRIGLYHQAQGYGWDAVRRLHGRRREGAYRELAWINYHLMLHESALDALSKIKAPTAADWALRARLHMAQGHWAQALSALQQTQDLSSLELMFWQAWCRWQMGDRESSRLLLADNRFGSLALMFGETPPLGSDGPWVALGFLAQRALLAQGVGPAHEAWLKRLVHPEDLPREDKPAWRLLENLLKTKGTGVGGR